MNKIKFIIALAAVFLAVGLASVTHAADSAPAPAVQEQSLLSLKKDAPAERVSVDLFGTYSPNSGQYGEGVGVSYFLNSIVGVGVEAQYDGIDKGKFPDQLNVAGNLILRSPATILNLRPYLFGGGGRPIGDAIWEVHLGGGVEFKLAKHAALFGDWRVYADPANFRFDSALLERQQVRAGLRFNF
jgi:hypothetical protein